MIILFYNKHEDIKIKYHNNIISSEKSEKKSKKNREGTDVHGCTGTEGGAGMLATSLNARLLRCIWL